MAHLDPDITYFVAKLKGKREGADYVEAWNLLNHVKSKIMKLHRLKLDTGPQDMEQLREMYIKSCDSCSMLQEVLERRFHWPPR